MIKNTLRKLILVAMSISCFISHAQLIQKGYYQFPINPGQTAYVSGTMGELRGNHFHAGLDIKTGGVEGLPVYCSADGYVSRVKVSSYGYGLVLYVQHPNGQTTVYGHMQSFANKIEKKALSEQYKYESYEVDFYPSKTDFPVKKGDILGLSGNTGGSGGPHLHWEIRDIYSRALNPLLGQFSEVKDNISPILYKVGLTTLSSTAHVKNEFGFFSLTPIKTGLNTYSLGDITASGDIGLALNANDKLNGSSNNNGVAGLEVLVNGVSSYTYYNDRFAFSASKMINQHIEFDRYVEGYGHFHRCYVADGNSLDFYKTDSNGGLLKVKEGQTYQIKVLITDAYNNLSTLEFKIIGAKINNSITPIVSTKTAVKTKLYENILKVTLSNNGKDLKYFRNGNSFNKAPLYIKNDEAVYTFDLRKEFPDSIIKGNIRYAFNYTHMIVPNKEFTAYNKGAIIRFNKGDLKDTLYLEYKENNDVFEIGNELTPVYQNIKYILKPQKTYANKDKTAAYYYNGSYYSFVGGNWMGNNIEFSSNKMGTFAIKEDVTAPTIQLLARNTKYIKLKITDNLSGIKSYKATLDGKFMLMGFRYQTNTIYSIRQDENIALKGLFKLEVEDMMGNLKTYTLQL